MERHFDYFCFPNFLLTILCDENDQIEGYFTFRNGNEFGQIYVVPSRRGALAIHQLLRQMVTMAKSFGFTYVWGVCYDKMKKFYEKRKKEMGVNIEFIERPEQRKDGQWKVVLYIPDNMEAFYSVWNKKFSKEDVDGTDGSGDGKIQEG